MSDDIPANLIKRISRANQKAIKLRNALTILEHVLKYNELPLKI